MPQVRIMVVDDTITYRQILSKVVEGFPQADLIGTASSGKNALMKIPSLKPDLIFLDVMMPEMDGIETLKHIKKDFPHIKVVMISAFDMENAKATLHSLENGALDFIAKPIAQNMQEGIKQLTGALTPLIELVAQQLKGPQVRATTQTAPTKPLHKADSSTIQGQVDFVLLGISTGGPNALHILFDELPTKIACPVLIVQHMPPMFTQSLAERLDSTSCMTVVEAKEGDVPQAGTAYIAPGGKHMVLRKKGKGYELGVTDGPPVNHCKPSVDVLFRAAAAINQIQTLSVIMTGMGRDGTDGMRSLKRQGTYTLIQDESTSVVWGMPGSIHEAKAYDEMLPLQKIGTRILELTQHSA